MVASYCAATSLVQALQDLHSQPEGTTSESEWPEKVVETCNHLRSARSRTRLSRSARRLRQSLGRRPPLVVSRREKSPRGTAAGRYFGGTEIPILTCPL